MGAPTSAYLNCRVYIYRREIPKQEINIMCACLRAEVNLMLSVGLKLPDRHPPRTQHNYEWNFNG